jgi:hypothetical protein
MASDYIKKNYDEIEGFRMGAMQKLESSSKSTGYTAVIESDEAAHLLWFDDKGNMTQKDEARYDDWEDFDDFEDED